MAGVVEPGGGSHLELRLAVDAAAVRLMLRMERWEEAAEAAGALFNVCLKSGYQVRAFERQPCARHLGSDVELHSRPESNTL